MTGRNLKHTGKKENVKLVSTNYQRKVNASNKECNKNKTRKPNECKMFDVRKSSSNRKHEIT